MKKGENEALSSLHFHTYLHRLLQVSPSYHISVIE